LVNKFSKLESAFFDIHKVNSTNNIVFVIQIGIILVQNQILVLHWQVKELGIVKTGNRYPYQTMVLNERMK